MTELSSPYVIDGRPAPLSWVVLFLLCALFLYVSYRRLLPQPIPGIPYNKRAGRSLLGDLPELLSYIGRTQEVWPWFGSQVVKHQSPVVQVFARPFSKPWVIVTDHREAQDIFLRRTKEFDRANFVSDAMSGLVPDCESIMPLYSSSWLCTLRTPS